MEFLFPPLPLSVLVFVQIFTPDFQSYQFTVIYWNLSDAEHKLMILHRGNPSWKVMCTSVTHSAVIWYMEPKKIQIPQKRHYIYILCPLFVVAFKSIEKSLTCFCQKNMGPFKWFPNSDNHEHFWVYFSPPFEQRKFFSREYEVVWPFQL